ncbi:hypothetical protein RYX36_014826 [Vicia faba]
MLSYGALEFVRLLGRLFEQTYKLEDRMAREEPYLREIEAAHKKYKRLEDKMKEATIRRMTELLIYVDFEIRNKVQLLSEANEVMNLKEMNCVLLWMRENLKKNI